MAQLHLMIIGENIIIWLHLHATYHVTFCVDRERDKKKGSWMRPNRSCISNTLHPVSMSKWKAHQKKKTRWPTKNYLNTYERYKNHKIQRVLDRSHLHCCCKYILIADWNRWFIECMVCFYEAVRSILERLNVSNGIDRNCKFWCISGNTFIC